MILQELIIPIFLTLLSGCVGVIWTKSDRAEKTSEANKIFLSQLIKNLDKTAQLTERLTSLEASVQVEIKNLSISIKRLESAVLRMNIDSHNRTR